VCVSASAQLRDTSEGVHASPYACARMHGAAKPLHGQRAHEQAMQHSIAKKCCRLMVGK